MLHRGMLGELTALSCNAVQCNASVLLTCPLCLACPPYQPAVFMPPWWTLPMPPCAMPPLSALQISQDLLSLELAAALGSGSVSGSGEYHSEALSTAASAEAAAAIDAAEAAALAAIAEEGGRTAHWDGEEEGEGDVGGEGEGEGAHSLPDRSNSLEPLQVRRRSLPSPPPSLPCLRIPSPPARQR